LSIDELVNKLIKLTFLSKSLFEDTRLLHLAQSIKKGLIEHGFIDHTHASSNVAQKMTLTISHD